jgi:hypothetical protein
VEKKYVLTEAIECYHCNRSWIRWRCPDKGCGIYETTQPDQLLLHIWSNHFCPDFDTNDEIHYAAVQSRLMSVNFVPSFGHNDDLYIVRDNQGVDHICIRNWQYFNWSCKMLSFLAGEEQEDNISANDALQYFLHRLGSFNEVYTCFYFLISLFNVSDYGIQVNL